MSSPAASVRSRLSFPARGLAEAAVQRARLSVVPRRRTRAPKVPFVTLVSLLLLAGVVGLLLFNTSMQQAAFTTTALQDQATTLAARQQALEDEVEELRDPQNLGEKAQSQGMVQGCAPLFLDLGTGQVKGAGAPCQGTRLPLQAEEPARPGVLDPPARRVQADTTLDSQATTSAAGRTRTQP
jgi:cell division protein FtsB